VLAGVPLWCCTDSGVVSGDLGKGRQRNLLARAVDEEEAAQLSGLCRYWDEAVITTRYWLSGL
jgi:hypothetical protein